MPGFMAAFTGDLLAVELAGFPADQREATRRWVLQRVGGMSQLSRLGLSFVGLLIATGVRATTGRAYAQLPDARRLDLARRLLGSRLPLVADFVKALRALAVLHAYESRPR